MKNVNDYIKNIKIEKQDIGYYGYYPYYMISETKNKKIDIYCFIDFKGVEDCYLAFVHALLRKPKRIYLAMDFPKVLNSESDFVIIHSFESGRFPNIETYALPYNKYTGDKSAVEKDKEYIHYIDKQLKIFVNQIIKKVINEN